MLRVLILNDLNTLTVCKLHQKENPQLQHPMYI